MQDTSESNANAAALKSDLAGDVDSRKQWMAVLARAQLEELEAAWRKLAEAPRYTWLRPPQTGLLLLRGRVGGSGAKFNLGEASVTRCALRTECGRTGIAYVLGRSHRHAELAAILDAMLQDGARGASAAHEVVTILRATQAARRECASRKAAATKVNFYTLVRGEDPRC